MNKVKHDKSHQVSWCLRLLDGDDMTTFRLCNYEDWCPNSREYRRHGCLGNRSYRRPRSNDKKFFLECNVNGEQRGNRYILPYHN